MINTYDYVPTVYNDESRDFQLISRVCDVMLNYIKTSIDNLQNIPCNDNVDVLTLDLLTKTLGFNSKHLYNVDDLKKLCQSFKYIIKNKGSIKAIKDSVILLLNAYGVKYVPDISIEPSIDNPKSQAYVVKVYLTRDVVDLILLRDIFDHILPTGWVYDIYVGNYSQSGVSTSSIAVKDEVSSHYLKDGDLGALSEVSNSEMALFNGRLVDLIPNIKYLENIERLTTPEVSLSSQTISWDSVDGATKYVVYASINDYNGPTVLNINDIDTSDLQIDYYSITFLKEVPENITSLNLSDLISQKGNTFVGVMAISDGTKLNSKVKFIKYN